MARVIETEEFSPAFCLFSDSVKEILEYSGDEATRAQVLVIAKEQWRKQPISVQNGWRKAARATKTRSFKSNESDEGSQGGQSETDTVNSSESMHTFLSVQSNRQCILFPECTLIFSDAQYNPNRNETDMFLSAGQSPKERMTVVKRPSVSNFIFALDGDVLKPSVMVWSPPITRQVFDGEGKVFKTVK
jgi:hypothetical protein